MPTEFSVMLVDKPGTLAQLGSALGEGGVNIEAIAGSSRDGMSRLQFVCNAPDRAAERLSAAGIPYTTRECSSCGCSTSPVCWATSRKYGRKYGLCV